MTRELSDYLSELKERPATGPVIELGLAAYSLIGWTAESHLLLDEFQDAPVQWRVLQPLAEHVTRGSGRASFFCVGDAKQAIDGWRGGVAELFEARQSQFPACNSNSSTRATGRHRQSSTPSTAYFSRWTSTPIWIERHPPFWPGNGIFPITVRSETSYPAW